jgi:hypothetical protein
LRYRFAPATKGYGVKKPKTEIKPKEKIT